MDSISNRASVRHQRASVAIRAPSGGLERFPVLLRNSKSLVPLSPCMPETLAYGSDFQFQWAHSTFLSNLPFLEQGCSNYFSFSSALDDEYVVCS